MSENIVNETTSELSIQVIVSEKDKSIYVKLEGFEDIADAEDYAEFLSKHLPLLLFESEIIH
jgi:phage replication-related protein YjqB (UPF0714/DUF867 family)